MQYKVPQNIDLEDKIVGPLTLAQFLYLLFGGLIVYIAYQLFFLNARAVFFLIALPVGLLSLGLAFVKIYDRPLPQFIKHAISFVSAPRERVWHKEEALEGQSVVTGPTAKKTEVPGQVKQLPQTDLANLSQILDTYGKVPAAPVQGPVSPVSTAQPPIPNPTAGPAETPKKPPAPSAPKEGQPSGQT
jgi:hypothetical protein